MGLEDKCGCDNGCGCSDFDPFTEVNNDPNSKKLNQEINSNLEEIENDLNSYEKRNEAPNKLYSLFKNIINYFKS